SLSRAHPPGFFPPSLHDALPIWPVLAPRPVRFRARMPVQHLPRLAPAQTTPRPRADAAGSLGKVHQPPPALVRALADGAVALGTDRKSTRLNSSHVKISYAAFCL